VLRLRPARVPPAPAAGPGTAVEVK
jgi:hypothetical protein